MKSTLAAEIMQQKLQRQHEIDAGTGRAFMQSSAGRANSIQISNFFALPLLENPEEMQNDNGDFYFLDGYSKEGGPDVAR